MSISESWRDDALCNDPRIVADRNRTGEDLWFPNSHLPDAGLDAIAICADCPVRTACLAVAMADRTLLGIWGGTTEEQRNTARRRAQRKTTATAMADAAAPLTPAEEVEADALGALADAVLDQAWPAPRSAA